MYEQQTSQLLFIQCIWQATVVEADEYDDPAKDTWGLGFTIRADGTYRAELLGQSFQHKMLDSNIGDRYWGVEFYPYVTMRGVNKLAMLGQLVQLEVIGNRFFISNDSYVIPEFERLESFCRSLAEQGIITHATHVHLHQNTLSLRTRQRNHRETVGLTLKQVEQIKRAEQAAKLLKDGMLPIDVALETGYADQAHMTRSLKTLLGRTPARIKDE